MICRHQKKHVSRTLRLTNAGKSGPIGQFVADLITMSVIVDCLEKSLDLRIANNINGAWESRGKFSKDFEFKISSRLSQTRHLSAGTICINYVFTCYIWRICILFIRCSLPPKWLGEKGMGMRLSFCACLLVWGHSFSQSRVLSFVSSYSQSQAFEFMWLLPSSARVSYQNLPVKDTVHVDKVWDCEADCAGERYCGRSQDLEA